MISANKGIWPSTPTAFAFSNIHITFHLSSDIQYLSFVGVFGAFPWHLLSSIFTLLFSTKEFWFWKSIFTFNPAHNPVFTLWLFNDPQISFENPAKHQAEDKHEWFVGPLFLSDRIYLGPIYGSVCLQHTFCRLNWCDSGWRQLNTNW